jgi:hypothetical protein
MVIRNIGSMAGSYFSLIALSTANVFLKWKYLKYPMLSPTSIFYSIPTTIAFFRIGQSPQSLGDGCYIQTI